MLQPIRRAMWVFVGSSESARLALSLLCGLSACVGLVEQKDRGGTASPVAASQAKLLAPLRPQTYSQTAPARSTTPMPERAEGKALPTWQDVDSVTGAFTPQLSFDVLPTEVGPTPSLSLNYSPSTRDGVFGAGWSLSSPQTIERRGATGGVPTGGATDRYFFQGQELLLSAPGTLLYYAANDPFTKFERQTSSNGWRVTRNGVTRVFGTYASGSGCMSGNEYLETTCSNAIRWYLKSETDSLGNAVTYTYETSATPTPGAPKQRLTEIRYNNNRLFVRLTYSTRNDVVRDASDGVERFFDRRVASLAMGSSHSGTDVVHHQYLFDYTEGAIDGQTLLSGVRKSSADGQQTVPVVSYDYTNLPAEPGFEATWSDLIVSGKPLAPDAIDPSTDDTHNSFFLDVNQDGRQDIVSINLNCTLLNESSLPSGWEWELIKQNAFAGWLGGPEWNCVPKHRVHLATVTSGLNRFVRQTSYVFDQGLSDSLTAALATLEAPYQLADLNGDGFMDIVKGENANVPTTDCACGGGRYDCTDAACQSEDYTDDGPENFVFWGSASGWNTTSTLRAVFGTSWEVIATRPLRASYVDINADGLPDLMTNGTYILNRGPTLYFSGATAQSYVLKTSTGTAQGSTAEYPSAATAECLQNYAEGDPLGAGSLKRELLKWRTQGGTPGCPRQAAPFDTSLVDVGWGSTSYNRRSWLDRNSIFSDFNGDGVTDRLVLANWPRRVIAHACHIEGASDITEYGPVLVPDGETCGSTNRLYIGDGRGGFRLLTTGVATANSASWLSAAAKVERERVQQHGPVLETFQTEAVSHVARAQISGASRPVLLQMCGGPPARNALPLRGADDYGLNTTSNGCPAGASPVPSSTLTDDISLVDVDDDGFDDLVQIQQSKGLWVRWRRNVRPSAQNRLVAVVGPRGGRTEVEWTTANRLTGLTSPSLQVYALNDSADNVPVVRSVTRQGIETTYTFSEPLTAPGRIATSSQFVAFGRAYTAVSGGASEELIQAPGELVGCLQADFACRGTAWSRTSSAATLRTQRTSGYDVTNIEVTVPTRSSSAMFSDRDGVTYYPLLDTTAPTFNPVIRRCEFDLDPGQGVEDPRPYLLLCRDLAPADSAGALSAVPGPVVARVEDYTVQPGSDQYAIQRNRRDPSVLSDNVEWQRSYNYSSTLNAYLLSSEVQIAATTRRNESTYTNYLGTNWRTQIQSGGPGGVPRTRTRSFLGGVIASESTWNSRSTTTYTYDGCGQKSRIAETIGTWRAVQRDSACRVSSSSSSDGTSMSFSYDALQRTASATLNAVRTDGTSVGSRTTSYVYDAEASYPEAAVGSMVLEQDGSRTSSLTFVDGYDRTLLQSQCKRDPALPLTGANVLAVAGCATDPALDSATDRDFRIDTFTLYSTESGRQVGTVGPVDAQDGVVRIDPAIAANTTGILAGTWPGLSIVSPTSLPTQMYTFDDQGRMTQSRDAEGAHELYDYGLASRSVSSRGVTLTTTTTSLGSSSSRRVYGASVASAVVTGSRTLDPFESLVTEINANGEATIHSYDSWGRLSATVLPAADVVSFPEVQCQDPTYAQVQPVWRFEYNANDQLIARIDPRGGRTVYELDAYGRVATIRDAIGDPVARYKYLDGAPSAAVLLWKTSVCDALGADGWGNCAVTQNGFGSSVESQTDIGGAVRVFLNDVTGRQVGVTHPWGERIGFVYDRFGRQTQTVSTRGASVARWEHRYNARGLQTETRDPDGVIERVTYDSAGRQRVRQVGGVGEAPRVLVRLTYDPDGYLTDRVENGVTTRLEWDGYGRLSRERVAFDGTDALADNYYCYNAEDKVVLQANSLGEGVHHVFGRGGKELATRQVQLLTPGSCPASEAELTPIATSTFGHDVSGNVLWTEDADGVYTCSSYDADDRLVQTRREGLGATDRIYERNPSVPYAPGGESKSLRIRTRTASGDRSDVYVRASEPWLIQKPDGSMVRSVKTPATGLLSKEERLSRNGTTAAVKATQYLASSRSTLSVSDWMRPSDMAACAARTAACPVGSIRYAYTAGGRISSLTDVAGAVTRFGYAADGSGLLTSTVLPSGVVRRFIYDEGTTALGATEVGTGAKILRTAIRRERGLRVTQVDVVEASKLSIGVSVAVPAVPAAAGTEISSFAYDAVGRRTAGTFTVAGVQESQVSWRYEAGRLCEKQYLIDGQTQSLGWSFTPAGRLRAVTYPTGQKVRYDYHLKVPSRDIRAGSGLLQAVVLEGAGPQGADALIAAFGAYDDSARLTDQELAYGMPATVTTSLSIGHGYADGAESARIFYDRPGGQLFYQETYATDPLGRQTRIDRTFAAGSTERDEFAYDARDYVVSEEHERAGNVDRLVYTYARNGDRTAVTTLRNGTQTSSVAQAYFPGSRLKVGALAVGKVWDLYGRQLTNSRGEAFGWGLGSQLRSLGTNVGGVAKTETMFFDVDGQRVKRSLDGTDELYLSSDVSGEVLFHRSSDGETEAVVRGPGGGVLATIDRQNFIKPLLVGGEDSTSSLVQASGLAGATRTQQTAFGKTTSGTSSTQLGFHQTWSTSSIGLRVAGVRIYDVDAGRFVSPDPLHLMAAPDPNDAFDVYRYAKNNPVALQDSNGFAPGPRPPQLGDMTQDAQAPAWRSQFESWDACVAAGTCTSRESTRTGESLMQGASYQTFDSKDEALDAFHQSVLDNGGRWAVGATTDGRWVLAPIGTPGGDDAGAKSGTGQICTDCVTIIDDGTSPGKSGGPGATSDGQRSGGRGRSGTAGARGGGAGTGAGHNPEGGTFSGQGLLPGAASTLGSSPGSLAHSGDGAPGAGEDFGSVAGAFGWNLAKGFGWGLTRSVLTAGVVMAVIAWTGVAIPPALLVAGLVAAVAYTGYVLWDIYNHAQGPGTAIEKASYIGYQLGDQGGGWIGGFGLGRLAKALDFTDEIANGLAAASEELAAEAALTGDVLDIAPDIALRTLQRGGDIDELMELASKLTAPRHVGRMRISPFLERDPEAARDLMYRAMLAGADGEVGVVGRDSDDFFHFAVGKLQQSGVSTTSIHDMCDSQGLIGWSPYANVVWLEGMALSGKPVQLTHELAGGILVSQGYGMGGGSVTRFEAVYLLNRGYSLVAGGAFGNGVLIPPGAP